MGYDFNKNPSVLHGKGLFNFKKGLDPCKNLQFLQAEGDRPMACGFMTKTLRFLVFLWVYDP